MDREDEPTRPILVRVSRTLAASPERIFDAWLDPAAIGRWMFGPALRDEEVLHIKVDPRVGGKFSFLVRRQGTELDHVGTYRALDRPQRLVFTWGIVGESEERSVVTVEIRAAGPGCELTLLHEISSEWADYTKRTEEGWSKMLDALAALHAGGG